MSDIFGIGQNVRHNAVFVPSDIHGNPPPITETPTAHDERVRENQRRRDEKVVATTPAEVWREWMQVPANRLSLLAARIAERPELMPQAEIEPRQGERAAPGSLCARIAEQASDHYQAAISRQGRQ